MITGHANFDLKLLDFCNQLTLSFMNMSVHLVRFERRPSILHLTAMMARSLQKKNSTRIRC